MSARDDIIVRSGLIYLLMILMGLAILGKVVILQFVQGDELRSMSDSVMIRSRVIEPNRGNILAADQRVLATSIPYFEIRMDTRSTGMDDEIFNQGLDSLSWHLSRLFGGKSQTQWKDDLQRARRRGERYYLIRRRADFNELTQLKQFPIFRLGQYKGGLIVVQENQRILPHLELASRTIGYLTKGSSGNVVGIEGAYDEELQGQEGYRIMQRLSGSVWMPVPNSASREPLDGKDVVTTIDVDLQDVAESALMRQLKAHDAHHGTAILMEVKTGDIKAIANLEKDEEGEYHELYNYAVGESTEPGSTFKLFAMMVALEEGVVRPGDSIATGRGTYRVYDKTIKDSHEGGYGTITARRVFEVSSNVGMSKIVYEHFKDRQTDFVDRLYSMDLHKPLGVEIKGEGNPLIRYPGDKYWSGISLAMMSHGYEVQLTPLQQLAYYNAVANDGRLVKPRFVKEIRYHGKVIREMRPEVLNPSICSKETLAILRSMMEGVVEDGTAKNLRNDDYRIAGKTGTAQVANEKYGYQTESGVSYQASFAGYFPADDPRYSCIVVVNSPSNSVYYGNMVAGPVFKEIADKVYAKHLFRYRNLLADMPDTLMIPYTKSGHRSDLAWLCREFDIPGHDRSTGEWVASKAQPAEIVLDPLKWDPGLVPNVVSMGLQDAVYLLEKAGLKVQVSGRGTVRKQSLLPGKRISKGEVIRLEMSIQ